MVVKKGRKKCFYCKNFVNLNKDHFVLIGTYNRSVHKDDEDYFHFDCFVKWFVEKVEEKSKRQLEFMQEKVFKLLDNPLMKNFLKEVEGSDALIKMVSTDLKKVLFINLCSSNLSVANLCNLISS